MNKRRLLCLLLTLVLVFGLAAVPGAVPTASAAGNAATLTVDLDRGVNTGEIIHGAAGFLYGVSSEDVPTTNTIVPLKSKILVTKGALGTEHPYGDALDVAKTFLESGGEQVQMYNSNYYGVFGVTATTEQYANDLKEYICPAIVDWKDAWKNEHSNDNLSVAIDIDEAIVYVPINEGTPNGGNFQNSWKTFYEAIKSVDENANIAGPNSAGYGWQFTAGQSMESFIQFCADNNCMPDVITWHELEINCLGDMQHHMDDFRDIWYNRTDWTAYNKANGIEGTDAPEIPQICINEYAEMAYCGVPGRLVNWIARLEDEKITGCLPFWHQANNLNDLAAGANEGNGAWWLYQWYGNMSGTTQPVTTSTSYEMLYGVSTMDEAKKLSTTLLGGWDGDITVELNNVTATETFAGAACVDVTVEETVFNGFHTSVTETPTILQGTYPVNADGSVTITIPDALFESAYKVTVSQSTAERAENPALTGSAGDVYEAELAQLSGGAAASSAGSNPSYYMSGSGNRAVDMPSGASMTYTISVPVDGRYKLDFVYGNGQGSERNNMNTHNPVNVVQTIQVDDGAAQQVTLESTLFETMTGSKTLYYDLTAGIHTVTVTTTDDVHVDGYKLFHDFLRVSYAAAYGEDTSYNRVFEAELADFNKLLGNADSTVSTQTNLAGYSGSGYVTGLSGRSVENGGGIRFTVVTEESGLYNLTLRYQADSAGFANLYVGNTAMTLDRVNKTVSLSGGSGWQTVTASVYLQKGINVVDLDATVDAKVDYLRVRALDEQTHSTTIEAESATLSEGVRVAESAGASGGQYVVGMPGSYTEAGRQYLEFTYNAPSAGKYQMQVFHSNEDLAGSHSYNIKAIDKYAVVEVNGESDSPVFTLTEAEEEEPLDIYYFVDCGDHNPTTVSTGDSLGSLNSVTDQIYGADEKTGYSWGVVMEQDDEMELDYTGGSWATDPSDQAVYTTYQRAASNSASDLLDGKAKTESFRYAHGQDTAGISPRYLSYGFELDPGKYDVTVCMGNSWGNAGSPTVTFSAEGMESVTQAYQIGGFQIKTVTLDLTDVETNENGRVELSVRATSLDATIQMNYILITEEGPKDESGASETVTLPGGVHVDRTSLPEGIYIGEIADGVTKYLDFRNLKSDTDRYFFINTFSDDTFREKTITLDLQQGENTIRIYNDNSWNVTYGGTQATPGLNELPNYTPNFDKFVITPMALDTAVPQTAQYNVTVSTTTGGTAVSDKTLVNKGGSYTLTITAEDQPPTVYVNGAVQEIQQQADGTYTVTVTNVTADQEVEVYFLVGEAAVRALVDELNALDWEDYTSTSRDLLEQAIAQAEAVLENPTSKELLEVYALLEQASASLSPAIEGLTYFVDCGDHDPSTVTGTADDFGSHNSVTDQLYGADPETGYSWGVVMETTGEQDLGWKGGSLVQSSDDKAIYTTYQRAFSNAAGDLADGQAKTATFRYAHGQDSLSTRYVSYAFELEPGTYDVTVCMSTRNDWGNNSKHSLVTLSAEGVAAVSKQYEVPDGSTQVETMSVDLTGADLNERDLVKLSIKGTTTSGDASVQMCYITIVRTDEQPEEPEEIPATGVTLNRSTATLQVGEILTLDAAVEPATATDKTVTWSSSKEEVATVKDGVVTAVAAGEAVITATTANGKTAACTVTVTEETTPAFDLKEIAETLADQVYSVAQSRVNTGAAARAYAQDRIDALLPAGVTGTVISESFTAAQAGSLLRPAGVDGQYVFTVRLSDGETACTTEALTLTIRATAYDVPDLPVVPGGSSHEPETPNVQTEFSDVDFPSWYYDAVLYVCENGYMNGVAEGRFDPEGAVTRAMVWTVLARMDGVNTEGAAIWYSKAQTWVMETGVSDGTDPMGAITREQLAAMLYRFEGSPKASGDLSAYPDAGTVSDWAKDALVWATQTGLVNGINGNLSPKTGATRAQLATMLMRMLES